MLGALFAREIGAARPSVLRTDEELKRSSSLQLSTNKSVTCESRGPINGMELERQEGRYLLCGSGDATMAIFDLLETYNSAKTLEFEVLCKIGRGEASHTRGVTCVRWYPHDTGMFLSAGFDHIINVWDTNRLTSVCKFTADNMVFNIALSPLSMSHTLIACAAKDSKLRLADLRTGGFTHCLLGHSKEIRSVDWSPSNEFILASGSADHTVRFWDVRRAGVLLMLDQHNTSEVADNSESLAHNGAVNSLKHTPDGLFLMTSGKDNRLKMWDTATGRNTLVNFPGIRNNNMTSIQMEISQSGQLVYHPNGDVIGVYDVQSGVKISELRGHLDNVHCCVVNPYIQELYSGGADNGILCWTPRMDEMEMPCESSEPSDEWSE